MSIKKLLLLMLVYSASLLSMELESKKTNNQQPDGLLEIDIDDKNDPFYYIDSKYIHKRIQEKVEYKIPDSMPIFYAHYYLNSDTKYGPKRGIHLPLSCLFIKRNKLDSNELVKVIIEEKEYKLKLTKAYGWHYQNTSLSTLVERYKQFIDPSNKSGLSLFLRKGTWQPMKAELLKNKIIESVPCIHGPNGYPAFMKKLSITRARLAIIEKECENQESYLNVLPPELIVLLKKFIDNNAQWAHLDPLLDCHERIIKEIERDEKALRRKL